MRRAFFHVDEFREMGMLHIPYLACVTDPLVLWSPSPLLLESTPGAFLKPRDLLQLIDREDAPIRIIGRKEWLLDKRFRNSHEWELARWVDEFDNKIQEFAIKDDHKPLLSRRVIIAGDQKGSSEADRILESPIGTTIARKLNLLFENRLLPPGILDKARRAREKRSSVPRAILGDMYNHRDAVSSAGAQIAVTPCEHIAVLQRVIPNLSFSAGTSFEPAGQGYASSADIRDAVKVLRKVKPVMTIHDLKRFLKSGLKDELHNLIYSPQSLPTLESHLIRQVYDAIDVAPLFKRLFPANDPIALSLNIGGLALGLTLFKFTGNPQWSLISLAVQALQLPLRKYSLIPQAIKSKHAARALFFVVFGTARPKDRQIKELLSNLNREA